jgi:hypothetical protein
MFSYRQTVPIEFLRTEMAFEAEEQVLEFLTPFNVIFTGDDRQHIDCKSSTAVLPNI